MAFTKRDDWVDDPDAAPTKEGMTPVKAEDLLRYEDGIEEAITAAAEAKRTADGKADPGTIPDVSGFVTQADVDSAVDGLASSADIPDVSGLATQASVDALAERLDALEAGGGESSE
ncbi:hypothetical protein [Corynebacterium sp. AOP34-BR1-29]|uniref:hypothetical protein n=1 Tax=Corynebacterium sp. AOP34-BR1-29 TaxID=3457688 RepID=UPI004033F275